MKAAIASCTIATSAIESMLVAARSAAPHEACGLLLGQAGAIRAVVATENVAAQVERNFEIDPVALLRHHREARGRGEAVIGHYHSHPNGNPEPSRTDAARAVENGQIWLIIGGDAVTAWTVTASGSVHGRFEPVALLPR